MNTLTCENRTLYFPLAKRFYIPQHMSIKNENWDYCNICNRHILDIPGDKTYYDEEGNCLCEECDAEEKKLKETEEGAQ